MALPPACSCKPRLLSELCKLLYKYLFFFYRIEMKMALQNLKGNTKAAIIKEEYSNKICQHLPMDQLTQIYKLVYTGCNELALRAIHSASNFNESNTISK